jgi:hypothetical protein
MVAFIGADIGKRSFKAMFVAPFPTLTMKGDAMILNSQ